MCIWSLSFISKQKHDPDYIHKFGELSILLPWLNSIDLKYIYFISPFAFVSQLFTKQAHPQSTLPRPLWVRVMWTISRIQKCKSPSPKNWWIAGISTEIHPTSSQNAGIWGRKKWLIQEFNTTIDAHGKGSCFFFQPAKRIHLSRCPLNHAGSNDMYEVIGADTTSLPTFGKWVFSVSHSKGSFRFQKNISFGSTSQYILWSPRHRLIFFSDCFPRFRCWWQKDIDWCNCCRKSNMTSLWRRRGAKQGSKMSWEHMGVSKVAKSPWIPNKKVAKIQMASLNNDEIWNLAGSQRPFSMVCGFYLWDWWIRGMVRPYFSMFLYSEILYDLARRIVLWSTELAWILIDPYSLHLSHPRFFSRIHLFKRVLNSHSV